MDSPPIRTSGETGQRFPIFLLFLSVFCLVLLAVTTVWGALAEGRRFGAELRAVQMREVIIAEEASLDLPALRRGKVHYMTTCTACHGPKGQALPNLGKDLRNSEFLAGKSDSQLRMFLKLGRNTWDADNTTGVAMPGKGGNPMLTDDDLSDIVQFLRYLQAAAQH